RDRNVTGVQTCALPIWLQQRGIRFFPVVQWPEKGNYGDGSAVPRYHIAWGCGEGVTNTPIKHLEEHPQRGKLTLLFEHKVADIKIGRASCREKVMVVGG